MTRIDISCGLKDICDQLELDYHTVASLSIDPRSVLATVYRLNAAGSKYITANGPATEERYFEVKT